MEIISILYIYIWLCVCVTYAALQLDDRLLLESERLQDSQNLALEQF